MKALIWGLIAFLVSAGGSEMIRRGAARLRLLDVPNERSSHVQATPRGAGLALAVASGLALWGCHPWQLSLLLPLLGCQFSIAAIGLIDDMVSLPSLARLAVHVGVAGAFLAFYGDMPGIAAIWPAVPAFAGAVLSIAWLVGLTNAYNFMDGVDGMAGTQGVVAGAGWLLLGGIAGDPLLALLGGGVASACLGFLLLNWPPARIFMGDVGSGFLGFTFAAMTLLASRRDPVLAVCGLLLVWPFVFDTVLTFIRRLLRGENVLRAHRSHLYQRFVIAGWSHRRATVVYASLSALGAASAMLLTVRVPLAPLVTGLSIGIAATTMYARLLQLERRTQQPAVAER